MPVIKFQAQVYRINDFIGWNDRRELVLSPDFQRHPVWSPRGKSYLIDSIVRGMPLPQFFIREKVLPRERRTIREVVDGQQRLRTILDYIDDQFTMMAIHNPEFARVKFSQLPEDTQSEILSFPLSVNVLVDIDDADVLEIFARLNSYSVPLNQQELLNARFVGDFREKINKISKLFLQYWRDNAIFTSHSIARMKDVELTAELVGAMLLGLQHGKGVVKDLYKRYDSDFPMYDQILERFERTLGLVTYFVQDQLSETEYRRPPLFYSLFCAIYDCSYGLGSPLDITERPISEDKVDDVRQELFQLNLALTGEENGRFERFVEVSRSSTDKITSRRARHETLVSIIRNCYVAQNAD